MSAARAQPGRLLVGAPLFILFALFSAGCDRKDPARPAQAVPVVVAKVVQKDIPVQLRANGNVQAFSTVSVRTQVTGELTEVHFREGEDVKKGQLLFTLDRRPLEAELQREQATLARDQAQAENARAQAQRADALMKEGVMAGEQAEQIRANAAALEAAVRADQAAVENARVQLLYTLIYSPIDGRTGNLIVHRGNVVKANDNPPLVVINQLTPIYVEFAVPEQHLGEIKRPMTGGKLRVKAVIPAEEGRPAEGVLSFVDNNVDTSTGTIKLKATFPNSDKRLWPGQYVSVVLTLATRPDAVVVPSQAVQTSQEGQFVYVVGPDHTAEARSVKTSDSSGSETVIEQGLKPGELVVTDGQVRLFPGAKVEFKNAPTASQTSPGTSS